MFANRSVCLVTAMVAFAAYLPAQNLITNSSFETGAILPHGWSLYGQAAEGKWEIGGSQGGRSISVIGNGVLCPRYWSSTPAVQAGRNYVLRFMARATTATGGICTSGFDAVGRYYDPLPAEWKRYSYVLAMPNTLPNPVLKLGQCQVNGTYLFDEVELWPVLPVYADVDGFLLGDGESIANGSYLCNLTFGGFAANFSRALTDHTANFSRNGWLLETNRYVVYRHGFPEFPFTNAYVSVAFSSQSGELRIDASTNRTDWVAAGRFTAPVPSGTASASLPAGLLPSTNLFVRLSAQGFYWITAYNFAAGLPTTNLQATGRTWFFEQSNPESPARPVGVAETSGGFTLKLEVKNAAPTNAEVDIHAIVHGPNGERNKAVAASVPMTSTQTVSFALPTAGEGPNDVAIHVTDALGHTWLQGTLPLTVSRFADNSFGESLAGPANCGVWWCEGTRKVFRERLPPTESGDAIEIAAARNEYEPFQLVLRPTTNLSNVTFSWGPLVHQGGGAWPPISATNIEVSLVDYVPVTEVYDDFGAVGSYPDPLPPLAGPISMGTGSNQPIWFTLYVPKDAAPGEYLGTITVNADSTSFDVPVRLRVYAFGLSDVTHARAAYGLHVDTYWHGAPNRTQRLATYELYMRNFARHRASPYFRETNFDPLWPNWWFVNGGFTHSFTNFNANLGRWLDEFNFNNFKVLELPATLGGYGRFTPQYRNFLGQLLTPIMAHLRENGWDEKAYSFWIDEPQPHQYPYFFEGMQAHLEAAPGLNRLVPVWEMNPALEGHIDTWTPLLTAGNYDQATGRWGARTEPGEASKAWWYVAGWPKAPLPNNFVDHPAISPRIRAWMGEKSGMEGELYWYANYYWGSNSAPRNPWEQPMTKVHTGGNLGNGDGTLLYPPVKVPPISPVISEPVNSYRWEILREGQEDREYFWLLGELGRRAEARLGPNHPAVEQARLARGKALAIVTSASEYETNPAGLIAARDALAETIESLQEDGPWFAREPLPRGIGLGQTATLHSEALGWPLPVYQWQLNGTNLPGATQQNLILSNATTVHLGDYRVLAINPSGIATSRLAHVAGKWLPYPQILIQPASLLRNVGSSAAFILNAVSTPPPTYQWHFNDAPLPGRTSYALVLTNVTAELAGRYHVVASTPSGSATSTVAELQVRPLTTTRTLVPAGATWRYHDKATNLGSAWRGLNYNDAAWSQGPAQLGFGDGDEETLIGYGPNPTNKAITTYFRHTFTNPWSNTPANLILRILRDDGAVAYLNGVEFFRSANMPDGAITYASLARGSWINAPIDGADEATFFPFGTRANLLRPGTNVLAVEIHQFDPTSDDLSFDAELLGTWHERPSILTHPAPAVRRPGESLAFSVTAASVTSPLAYQWYFGGSAINGATESKLRILGVNPMAAGNYQVSVANSAGTVFSESAELTVLPLPTLQAHLAAPGTGFQLMLPPDSGYRTIQVSTNLADWADLTNLPPSLVPIVFQDGDTAQHPVRFYRLRQD